MRKKDLDFVNKMSIQVLHVCTSYVFFGLFVFVTFYFIKHSIRAGEFLVGGFAIASGLLILSLFWYFLIDAIAKGKWIFKEDSNDK